MLKKLKLQLLLFALGILTFGFLDGFTAILMIDKYGPMVEFNPLFRHIAINYGKIELFTFKNVVVFMVLLTPLLLQKYSREPMYWTVNGFLSVFTVSGAIAAIDNYLLFKNGLVYIDPRLVLGMTLVSVVFVIQLGDIADRKEIKDNRFKISDEEWSNIKGDMGYP